MIAGDIVYIKADINKTEHEVIDKTYDREGNEMYTLEGIEDDFYPSELVYVR